MSKETEQTKDKETPESGKDLKPLEHNAGLDQKRPLLANVILAICILSVICLAVTLYFVVDKGKQELAQLKTQLGSDVENRFQEITSVKSKCNSRSVNRSD